MFLSDGQEYAVAHADCIEHMHAMPERSVDFMLTSVPFPSVFAYTSSEADLGNSEDLDGAGRVHFSFWFRALRRVLKPGRVALVHCMDIPRLKRSGESGLYPFADLLRRLALRAGFDYEYTWTVRKNPQAQALRTKKWELKFQGLETDRANARGALPDWLVKFQAPGVNAVPVRDAGGADVQVSRNDWISWAECTWNDVRETDTLNNKKKYPVACRPDDADGPDDTRHICPLQIGLINRAVRLYTNPGEVVFDPFAGVASVGYEAARLGRRFYGCELKDEYHRAALANLAKAVAVRQEDAKTLFGA